MTEKITHERPKFPSATRGNVGLPGSILMGQERQHLFHGKGAARKAVSLIMRASRSCSPWRFPR